MAGKTLRPRQRDIDTPANLPTSLLSGFLTGNLFGVLLIHFNLTRMVCALMPTAAEESDRIARKLRAGLCITPYCRRRHRKKRRKCNTCRARLYDRPLNRLWRNLKTHAKSRGKVFAIPYPCFLLWCAINDYTPETVGAGKGKLSVDRRFPFVGYLFGNMQPLTSEENSRKQFVDARIYGNWQKQEIEIPF